jgi:hypothetical protein
VWVASSIKGIQVVDEGGGIMGVIEVAVGGCPEGNGGRAESAVIKT